MRVSRGASILCLVAFASLLAQSCGKDDDDDDDEKTTEEDDKPTAEQTAALAEVARCSGIEPNEVAVTNELNKEAALDWCIFADRMGLFNGIQDEADPIEIP